jgi:hypothetical protein
MNRALLGLAALSAMAALSPAQGQSFAEGAFSLSSGFGNVRSVSPPVEVGPGHYLPLQRGHGRHIHVADVLAGYGSGYGAGGYYDYGDFDGNRSFDPDKWNDWWHDRPDRAYPRWMSRNQDCARPWYSGDVLTC